MESSWCERRRKSLCWALVKDIDNEGNMDLKEQGADHENHLN